MDNFIIHQHAKEYHWSGECFLSIKSFYNGQASYTIGHKEYQVDQNSFLILNECTNYNLHIDTENDTESFCVFFSPEFASKIIAEQSLTDSQLLDLKTENLHGIRFLERKYPNQGLVSSLLLKAKRRLSSTSSVIEIDEFYHELLGALIQLNMGSQLEAGRLALKKKSTRVEIYQRIQYAKDFIESNYKLNLTLAEIAAEAVLSENHLLRCFKQIFGITPFQYISNLRIEEASRQIMQTDKTISEIAMDVGYTSMSNFSHYFKTIIGKAPSKYKSGDI